MSFILDALKRAERERRLERPPDLTAVYEEDHLPRQGIQPWLWLAGAFLIGAVVVALILWPDSPPPDRPPVTAKTPAARSAPASAAIKEETPAPAPSPKDPATKLAEAPPVQAPPQTSPAPVQEIPPPAAPAPVQGTPPVQTAKTIDETPDKQPPTPVGEGTEPPASPVLSTRETEAVQAPTSVAPAPEETPVQPPPSSAPQAPSVEPATAEPTPAPPPADPTAEVQPGKPAAIPLISELPFEVRQKLGKLQINVHSYSENPADRLVFINMKNVKAGDRIGENGPVLKEITPEGAIIDYGEGQARLQVGR